MNRPISKSHEAKTSANSNKAFFAWAASSEVKVFLAWSYISCECSGNSPFHDSAGCLEPSTNTFALDAPPSPACMMSSQQHKLTLLEPCALSYLCLQLQWPEWHPATLLKQHAPADFPLTGLAIVPSGDPAATPSSELPWSPDSTVTKSSINRSIFWLLPIWIEHIFNVSETLWPSGPRQCTSALCSSISGPFRGTTIMSISMAHPNAALCFNPA